MKLLCLALTTFAAVVTADYASRSGLNNIPNADTSAAGTGVVQGYSTFGEDRKPAFLSGARWGFAPFVEKLEAGFDTRWKPGTTVPVYFNAKWVASRWDATLPAFAIGVANLTPRSRDRDRLGQPQTYGAFTYDAGFARLHAGYAVQRRNNAIFFGFDRSWMLDGRKLTFRSDVIEIQNASQWLASAGFTFKLTNSFGLELWESKPTERGKAYTNFKMGWGFKY